MKRIILTILGFSILITTVTLARESNFSSSHYKYVAVFDKEAKDN